MVSCEVQTDFEAIGLLSYGIEDTYGIEVAEGQNDALSVARAVCIDQMGRGE